ncbi:EamA-like transporter family protein [Vibrio astriarenae]|uniref:EamA-like transporter family protein n=1 Tax=Vibrio astriarenae TaxID=1481923 RepID=A0A7Z2T2A9_9VIBR|nr:DMT family transporter [Vibrio astriarenae]QIA63084.1 EamA-like transporter family protein [Vibrio astriarenae]
MNILYIVLVVVAGMGLSFEAGLLGPLGEQVGHLWATLSIFGVGSALLWMIRLFTPQGKFMEWNTVPRWQLIGGLLGPIYVVALTLSTPVLGVAMTMICVLLGQVTKSFAIDYFGWFGMPKQATKPLRVLGLVFIFLALCFVFIGAQS